MLPANRHNILLVITVLIFHAEGNLLAFAFDSDAFSCVHNAIQGIQGIARSPFFGDDAESERSPLISVEPLGIPTELKENHPDNEILPVSHSPLLTPILTAKNAINETFSHVLIHHPESVLKEQIRYLLFTNNNTDKYQVMPKDGSVEGTNWDSSGKTKVLIHGLTSSYWYTPIRNIWTQHIFEVKDAYLSAHPEEGAFNVVVVDWTSLSTVSLKHYPDAAKATKVAGEGVAEFLNKLKDSGNIRSWTDVHIIGHSLGSHVAGVAGYTIQDRSSDSIVERITGLDPAGLCFDTSSGLLPHNPTTVLDKTDAKFVDIIHTNAGNIISSVVGRYGSVMETGHVDFYPNGGEVQHGCTPIDDRLNFCSHQKSVIYFARSIMEKVLACPCNNWESYSSALCTCDVSSGGQYIGESCNSTARGKFYLAMAMGK